MKELPISNRLAIPLHEIELTAIRAQGAGGQHVNKVATGIHLRFDLEHSSLPDEICHRVRQLQDHRISKEGVVVIKAQQSRSQEQNRQSALLALQALLKQALLPRRKRRPTKPTRSSREKRLQQKARRAQTKALRRKVFD